MPPAAQSAALHLQSGRTVRDGCLQRLGTAAHLHRDDGLGQDVQGGREAGSAIAQAAALADALLEVQALLAEALQGARTHWFRLLSRSCSATTLRHSSSKYIFDSCTAHCIGAGYAHSRCVDSNGRAAVRPAFSYLTGDGPLHEALHRDLQLRVAAPHVKVQQVHRPPPPGPPPVDAHCQSKCCNCRRHLRSISWEASQGSVLAPACMVLRPTDKTSVQELAHSSMRYNALIQLSDAGGRRCMLHDRATPSIGSHGQATPSLEQAARLTTCSSMRCAQARLHACCSLPDLCAACNQIWPLSTPPPVCPSLSLQYTL